MKRETECVVFSPNINVSFFFLGCPICVLREGRKKHKNKTKPLPSPSTVISFHIFHIALDDHISTWKSCIINGRRHHWYLVNDVWIQWIRMWAWTLLLGYLILSVSRYININLLSQWFPHRRDHINSYYPCAGIALQNYAPVQVSLCCDPSAMKCKDYNVIHNLSKYRKPCK